MRVLLVFLCALAACSSPKTLRETAHEETQRIGESIRKNIDDPDRAKAMLVVQSRVEKRVLGHFDDVEGVRDKFAVLNKNYGATRAEFRALQSQVAAVRNSATTELIKLAMEARAVATPEDWAAVAKDVGK